MWKCERIKPDESSEIVQDVTVEFEKGTEMDLSGAGQIDLAHLKSKGEILGSLALFGGSIELQPQGFSLSGGLVRAKDSYVSERLQIPETWEMTVVPES